MGKLGAQELNYVSDVDLIYVVEPADMDTNGMTLNRVGTKMATTLQRVCQSVIMGVAEPTLWQIDGGLRPEGKDGPARTQTRIARSLLRTVGGKLGIPSPAQGPPRGR